MAMVKKYKSNKDNTIYYNPYAPNRAARRRGVVAQEPPKEQTIKERIQELKTKGERGRKAAEMLKRHNETIQALKERRQQAPAEG